MRPFEWPYTILPLLPNSLRHLLEAPLPILLGYSGTLPNDYKTFPHIIWVNLDEINPKKRIYVDPSLKPDIRLPSDKQLRSHIKPYYKHFISDKPIYNPTSHQLQASEFILEQIKDYWNSIISLLPETASFRAEGRFLDMEYILRFLLDRSPGENPMFIKNLVYSQLFMKYLDDKYSSQLEPDASGSVSTLLSTSSTEKTGKKRMSKSKR